MGSVSILAEGLASKQTDIYRDKFGWKYKADSETLLPPNFSLNSKTCRSIYRKRLRK
jgi:hypothetical protein